MFIKESNVSKNINILPYKYNVYFFGKIKGPTILNVVSRLFFV